MMPALRMSVTVLLLTLVAACGDSRNTDTPSDTAPSDVKTSSQEEIDGMSVYQLDTKWKTQNGDEIQFKDLKGNVLVVVMIYTSCQSACPRLVADMKEIESQITPSSPEGVKYVLVSIDPTHDTPERLKAFSIENDMTGSKWLFLQGTEESVRDFANVLAVRYTQISPVEFSHSNIISVFDQNGVMQHQQEGLDVDYTETVDEVLALAKENPDHRNG